MPPISSALFRSIVAFASIHPVLSGCYTILTTAIYVKATYATEVDELTLFDLLSLNVRFLASAAERVFADPVASAVTFLLAVAALGTIRKMIRRAQRRHRRSRGYLN